MRWLIFISVMLAASITMAQILVGPMIPVNPSGGGTGGTPTPPGVPSACITTIGLLSACTPQGVLR